MASLQQLETALRNADAAGDSTGARVLAGEIIKMRGQGAPAVPEPRLGSDHTPDPELQGQITAGRQEAYDQTPWYSQAGQAVGDVERLMVNGMSLGFADKGTAAAKSAVGEGELPTIWGSLPKALNGEELPQRQKPSYEDALKVERDTTQGAADRAGYATMPAEMLGSLVTGGAAGKAGLTLAGRFGTGAMEGVKGLLARSGLMAAEGAGYGALTAAGNDHDVKEGAAYGAVGGALGNTVGEGISAGASKIAGLFNSKPKIPSFDEINALKDTAYKEAENAGVVFTPSAVDRLKQAMVEKLTDIGYSPKLMPGAASVLEEIGNLSGKNVTLKGIDTVRKIAGNAYIPNNKGNNAAVRTIVQGIDDAITSPQAGDVLLGDAGKGVKALTDARQYASRSFKAEKISEAMKRAELQAKATGSGGNVDNKIRQKLESLLAKERGWTADEKAALEKAISGTAGQNAMRLAGKLSPSGNGLMAALGVGGAMVNPALGAASLGGMAAKSVADGMTKRNAEELMKVILAGGSRESALGTKNAVQRLAESKRDALARVLMGISAYGAGKSATPE